MVQREGKNREEHSRYPSIKSIAAEIGEAPAMVTKWLNEIYSDLFTLNDEKPELFKANGAKYSLHFEYTSTKQRCYFTMWLDRMLVRYDRFDWWFINARIGTNWFYVAEITHERYKGELETRISLKSGFPNQYRDILLDKGLFLQLLDYVDTYRLQPSELDKILRNDIANNRPARVEPAKNYYKRRWGLEK